MDFECTTVKSAHGPASLTNRWAVAEAEETSGKIVEVAGPSRPERYVYSATSPSSMITVRASVLERRLRIWLLRAISAQQSAGHRALQKRLDEVIWVQLLSGGSQNGVFPVVASSLAE